MTKVELIDGEQALKSFIASCRPEKSPTEAFPMLNKRGSGGGLAASWEILRRALIANWLSIHLTGDLLKDEFNQIIASRAVFAKNNCSQKACSDEHEIFLQLFNALIHKFDTGPMPHAVYKPRLSLALLIKFSNENNTKDITKIINGGIKGLDSTEQKPNKSLSLACCESNSMKINSAAKRIQNKFYGYLNKLGALEIDESTETIRIELQKRHARHPITHFWPWLDCAFLKMASRLGASFEVDDFWFPKLITRDCG